MADMISRSLNGQTADDIARVYGVHPQTVRNYVNAYRQNNPTPLNIMDLTKEVAGEGGAQPVTRLGRAAAGISEAPEAIEQLTQRQLEQPGRVTNIIQRVAPGQNFEAEIDQLANQVRQQAAANYAALHAQPDVIINQPIADMISTPLGRSAWESARILAEAEGTPIPTYDELARTFGNRPRGGLGLNRETGQVEPPAQYPIAPPPVQPGAIVPARALDYFQRGLRLDAQQGGTKGNALNTLRQRFIEALDPVNPQPGQGAVLPGFRQTMADYRTGMGAQEALQAGANMTTRLGAPAREALAEFRQMTQPQQELFRMGFARRLMDIASDPNGGSALARQFRGTGTQDMVRQIFEPDDAEALIRYMRREGITTGTFHDIASGSRTAPLSMDMAKLLASARAGADVATGRWGKLAENVSNRITYGIGQRQGAAILNAATETDPATVLNMLNRMSQHARTSAQRQAYGAQALAALPISARPSVSLGLMANEMAQQPYDNKPRSVREWKAEHQKRLQAAQAARAYYGQ